MEDEALFFILISTHAPFVCAEPPTPFFRQMLRHLCRHCCSSRSKNDAPCQTMTLFSFFLFFAFFFFSYSQLKWSSIMFMDHLFFSFASDGGDAEEINAASPTGPQIGLERRWYQLPNNSIGDKRHHSKQASGVLQLKVYQSRSAFVSYNRLAAFYLIGCPRLPFRDKIFMTSFSIVNQSQFSRDVNSDALAKEILTKPSRLIFWEFFLLLLIGKQK
jgi:hypothetical protein